MSELIRANKVTTRFEGEGVMVGTFYKTHDKLGEVKSSDPRVAGLNYVMPQSTPATETTDDKGNKQTTAGVEVTPKQKLDSFKDFLQANATVFGFVYDPIDRRADNNKYPSTYTDATLLDTGAKILAGRMQEVVESVQKTVDGYVKQGLLAQGAKLACNIGIGNLTVQEKYANGNLKYADVAYPVHFEVLGKGMDINVPVKLVSGQIKKPRELNDKYALTLTGLKTALIDATVIPPAPKKEKEESKKEDAPANVAKCEDNGGHVEGTGMPASEQK